MWVLTESGELVNLDLVEAIDLVGNARLLVEAYYPRDGGSRTLCTCDDEEHGKRIIAELFGAIRLGSSWADIGAIAQAARRGQA